MPTASCPDVRAFQALLEESSLEGESDDLVLHVESCADCRQTLESLAGEASFWEDALRGLAETPREEPALRRLVEQLRQEEPTPAEDLSFLRPSDKPGLLGLLGAYEVQEEIGRGGMGVVLKAVDSALNRVVAVKVLSPYLACSATARRRFVREAQAAAAVCHDHIVTVYGVHEADGLPYLVMQYIAGESLQDRLNRCGPLEAAEIVRIGLQTALGLTAAHSKGLIHRDIKPANLLLEGEPGASATGGRIKITDFGLARMIDDVGLTQQGVLAGTPEYMAPEQARGEAIDHRSDLFSLGSVLYAMCTGLPPFRGSTAVAVLRQVSDETPAPIRSLNPEIPAWLEGLVNRLMEKNPANRIASAAEATALLEGHLAHLSQPATVPVVPLPPSPRTEGRELPASGLGAESRWRFRWNRWLPALLLVALGFGLSFLLQVPPPLQPSQVQSIEQDFRGAGPLPAPFELLTADGATVRRDEGGLRITVPASRKRTDGVSLLLRVDVPGDFEITTGYEILQADEPQTGHGVGMQLLCSTATPSKAYTSLSRLMRINEGDVYFTTRMTMSDDGREQYEQKWAPTTARSGQLRLIRTGEIIRSWAAEGPGGEFQKLFDLGFVVDTANLKEVRLTATQGWARNGIDLRIKDLRVRRLSAEQAREATAEPGASSPDRKRGWLPMVLGLCLVPALLVGLWLFVRRRSRPLPASREDAQPFVAFACAGCGKKLRANPALAGKRVKCSGCAQAVVVP